MHQRQKQLTATCPGPSEPLFELPPLKKPLSPHPVPPPALLAGVGLALAPPWVELLSWLTALSDVLSEFWDAIVMVL
jgi:hypothetical protein